MDRHGTFERTWDIQTDIFGQRDIFSYKYFGSLQPNGAITRHATYSITFLNICLGHDVCHLQVLHNGNIIGILSTPVV